MDPLHALSKIRVRLVLGFALAFLAMAAFGGLSYSYFSRMERKLVFLSQADGMVNMALEARRYEKNYFLYHHEKDFRLALGYLDQYESMLAADRRHLLGSRGAAFMEGLHGLAEEYRRLFREVHQRLSRGAAGPVEPLVQRLRAAGKSLVERAEDLARGERSGMRLLLQEYRPLLVVFLIALAALGALVAYSLLVRLVRPLHTIEEATKVVAQGDFRPIPWAHREDEIGSLVRAFNRMVVQLRHNNEQLVQTEKLTALGTLTSGVAHELNNPLNNISTSCQILLEEMDPRASSYHRELLTAVDEQVEKARDIVGSLLEFARQREFELRPEDLRTVVEESLKLIRGEIPSGVEVRVLVPPGVVLALDKAHMVQALLNLVMNGVQAMPAGGVLTIESRSPAGSGEVELRVEDTGEGIPPEVLPRVFDPFFTTKEVGQGTGLGLSITYGVIERHQGHIRAENRRAGGARFIITLPLGREEG
jgi:signal transduction histidine kinase